MYCVGAYLSYIPASQKKFLLKLLYIFFHILAYHIFIGMSHMTYIFSGVKSGNLSTCLRSFPDIS